MLTEHKTATIVFGPSQYGKSTLIASLMVDPIAARPLIGSGRGISVTRHCKTFSTALGLVQDTPGYNDTRLWMTPETIRRQASADLAKHGVARVKFVVMESLVADSMQLRATVEQLMETFGDHVKRSIVVVANKADRVDDADEMEQRNEYILETMMDMGIGTRLVIWLNKGLTPEQFTHQMRKLEEALGQTKMTNCCELDEIQRTIQVRAQELCDEQPPVLIEERAQVCETVTVEQLVDVAYEEQVLEKVCVKEGYKMLIERDDLQSRMVGGLLYLVTRGGLAAAELAWREFHRPKYEWKPKTITKVRKEARPTCQERMVWKTVHLPYAKPVTDFIDIARLEVLNEIRESLKSHYK